VTVCEMVCPMLSDHCLSLLSVCVSCLSVCDVGVLCQMVGWIRMPLGMEVGPGDIVLDGDPGPPKKVHSSPPLFGQCLLWT